MPPPPPLLLGMTVYFCPCATNSAGLTKVSLRDYLVGCLGIVPGTLAFVYIGASTAGTMNEEVCSTYTRIFDVRGQQGGGAKGAEGWDRAKYCMIRGRKRCAVLSSSQA